jgi:hypothetical protein
MASCQTKQGRPSFSEEKEAKRLSVLRALAQRRHNPQDRKFFWLLFFQKK